MLVPVDQHRRQRLMPAEMSDLVAADDPSPVCQPSNRKGNGAKNDRYGWKSKREGERQLRHGVFSCSENT